MNAPALDPASVEQLNLAHPDMPQRILDGSPDSDALAEVRQAQYDEAVAALRAAFDKVLDLQESILLNADAETHAQRLEIELDLLGL